MNRDYKLWRLILRQVCDGNPPPELETCDEQTVVYNSVLLVKGGFVEGEAIQDVSGKYAQVIMLNLTNRGHDLLEQLEAENHSVKKELPMPPKSLQLISIFISHSAKDEKLASALVALLRNALNMTAAEIRCTSVNGYRLPIGVDTEDVLRKEVHEAKTFIGLITPSSTASAYVMFELGARWGARLHLSPLLGAGAGSEYLRGPLSSLNALNCEDAAQVHQLISNLAERLGVQDVSPPAAYQDLISKLVEISKSERPTTVNSSPSILPSEHMALAQHPAKAHRFLDDYIFQQLLGLFRHKSKPELLYCGKCTLEEREAPVRQHSNGCGWECLLCGKQFPNPDYKPEPYVPPQRPWERGFF